MPGLLSFDEPKNGGYGEQTAPADYRPNSLWQKLANTWPARLASSAYNAVTLPGDVYAGRIDPMSDQGIGRSADLAGLVMGGAYGAAPSGGLGVGGGKLFPIRTSYGKVISMPITKNPSSNQIARELQTAPHGDVRALRSPSGDYYLWPANESMHIDVANAFDMPFKNRRDLQAASYLFNKNDVDRIGKYSGIEDLISKISQ